MAPSITTTHLSLSRPADDEVKIEDAISAQKSSGQVLNGAVDKVVDEEGENAAPKQREKLKKVDKVWDRRTRRFRYAKTTKDRNNDPLGSYVISIARIFDEKASLQDDVELVVRGSYLREILDNFYRKVGSISFADCRPSRDAVRQIFHAREHISRLLEEERNLPTPDVDKIFELEAALELIEHHFSRTISELRMLGEDEITYPLLWTRFPPHAIVYKTDGIDESRAVRVLSISYKEMDLLDSPAFRVEFDYVDNNGTDTGFVKPATTTIFEFQGIQKFGTLPLFPLYCHQDGEAIKTRLIQRGEKASSLCQRTLQQYSGVSIGDWDTGLKQWDKFSADGRVMLDPIGMEQAHPNHKLNVKLAERLRKDELGPQHYLLWNPRLRGFSLEEKRWGAFAVENLHNVDWDKEAFDCLLLPEEKKDFLQDLVMAQGSDSNDEFDDFIRGKGKSLVGLLSGPPGVGKTLTAEAIAELAEKPLYKLSSGELGDTPSSIQKQLSKILKLTELWKAVLLLDEADVFLAARTDNDLTQTAITSIFLKELEYYSGILLLTTNRLRSIDDAFQSRIHFHFEYQELSGDTRLQIWRQFIDKIRTIDRPEVQISDTDLLKLSKMDLNARQIKNVLRISQLVAKRRGKGLTPDVIRLAAGFNNWNTQPSTEQVPTLI